ncbi:unnamed protein product [Trichobilharzia regenti]|nr:unnamed protein product [Trichobilharzia regenti]
MVFIAAEHLRNNRNLGMSSFTVSIRFLESLLVLVRVYLLDMQPALFWTRIIEAVWILW